LSDYCRDCTEENHSNDRCPTSLAHVLHGSDTHYLNPRARDRRQGIMDSGVARWPCEDATTGADASGA
jgi:hypothetical protein